MRNYRKRGTLMKYTKPDDYFNNGHIEIARYGRNTFLKNNMTEDAVARIRKDLINKNSELMDEIDGLVNEIQKLVISVNPLRLLKYSSNMFKMSLLNISSEFDLPQENVDLIHMTEYIQSILVSTENEYDEDLEIDEEIIFSEIHQKIENLQGLIKQFYISWGAKLQEEKPELGEDVLNALLEAQFLFGVRGQRYQCFEKEYHEGLLLGHNNIFQKLFDLSSQDIIDGIDKLEFCLSQKAFDKLNDFMELFDEFSESGKDIEVFLMDKKDKIPVDEVFGFKLNDVLEQTNWNEKFVSELSYGLNESNDFLTRENFAGWPIVELPIIFKPFIKIEGKYYCFDYYNFIDNIYRTLQKSIGRLDPTYKWSDVQQELSENFVNNIFKKILPGCSIHKSNYYPIVGKNKQFAENDLLIEYDNVLIVVEVKAGSFVYTAPIVDFEAHIKSYQTLIEKADLQCSRTVDYLKSKEVVPILDENHKIKTEIDMTQIEDIYMMSITMDNINDFAAKAEKIAFLNLECNAICIAIDDLMVYEKFFEHPTQFLHFLSQRRLTTQNKKMILNDELDHLGLYIKHNYYNFQTEGIPDDTKIKFDGYRNELDKYFTSLYHPNLIVEKPIQKIPEFFTSIINFVEKNEIFGRVQLVKYLLDFSSEAKEDFCEKFAYLVRRQKELNRMISLNSMGEGDDLRYSCFVYQKSISPISEKNVYDYVYTKIFWNNETDRALIIIYYDENNNLENIKFKLCGPSDIKAEDIEKFKKLGEQEAQQKLIFYKNKNKKIGKNVLCPCDSGKKYKKCCFRRNWKYFK